MSRNKVLDFLLLNDAYTLHRTPIYKFPRRSCIVRGVNLIYQANLLELQKFSKHNDEYRYLLIIVDGFSRYAYTYALFQKSAIIVQVLVKWLNYDTPSWINKDTIQSL